MSVNTSKASRTIEIPDPKSFVMQEVVVCAQCEKPVKDPGENYPECTQARGEAKWEAG